jgi:hypothetical protein
MLCVFFFLFSVLLLKADKRVHYKKNKDANQSTQKHEVTVGLSTQFDFFCAKPSYTHTLYTRRKCTFKITDTQCT